MLIPIPDLARARRLLCVQPHYDDNDIGAGGTIASLAAAGAEVFYLTVTDDLVGVLDTNLSDAEATARLRAEQAKAGAEIGVTGQHWLGYPDAGDYDAFELRGRLIQHIRMLRPDFVFSVDPWFPYEAHPDHVRAGRATAEACLLHRHLRLPSPDPEVDRDYEPYGISGIVFYFTAKANLMYDISQSRERKHRAIDAYSAQFTPEELRVVHAGLEAKERQWAGGESFSHAEALMVLHPAHLHVNPDADEMF